MKYRVTSFFILFIGILSACTTSNVPTSTTNKASGDSQTLFTVDGNPIMKDEFRYVYTKNNFNKDSVDLRTDISEYLDLFVNFKLKVKEAFALGMDKDPAFVNELEGYRKQLAKPYLKGKEVTDELTRQAYDRMREELDVSHILIMCDPDADPADSLKAYNRTLALKERGDAGEDFGDLAFEYSEGPSGKPRKGRLGYFSALQMVYEFEDMAYNTTEGEVSMPVRTRYGYHLIKVHDRRESKGKVNVSHIMVKTPQSEISEADSISYRDKIYEIHKQLVAGGNWNQLCNQFSEDQNSKRKGGQLNTFGTGAMVASFEDAAFGLAKAGDISEPIRTIYGWHIIRLNEKIGLGDFDEAQEEIEKKVSHDSRSELNRKLQIQKLSANKSITDHEATQALYLKAADSSYQDRSWKASNYPEGQELVLLTIDGRNYTLANFYTFVENNLNGRPDASPKFSISKNYQRFKEDMIINQEEEQLAEKYPDYRYLYNEYKEGILLFNLMDERVWSKAVNDSTGIANHYAAHRDDYKWEERADYVQFSAVNAGILDAVAKVEDWKHYELPNSELTMTFEKSDTVMNGDQAVSLINLLKSWTNKKDINSVIETHTTTPASITSEIENYFSRRGYGKSGVDIRRTSNGAPGILSIKLYGTSPKLMEEFYNRSNPLNLKIESGQVEQEKFDFDTQYWTPGTYRFTADEREQMLIVKEILPQSPKELKEVRGLVISDYQDQLEKNWIKELKEKYPVTRNSAVLEDLINELSQ